MFALPVASLTFPFRIFRATRSLLRLLQAAVSVAWCKLWYSFLYLCPSVIAAVRLLQKAGGREASQPEEFLLYAGPPSQVLVMPLTLVEQVKAKHVGHSGGSYLPG